jgi:hypothetical protein
MLGISSGRLFSLQYNLLKNQFVITFFKATKPLPIFSKI